MSFNLTEWALRHRSLTQFFLILLTAAGLLSYATLGLKEEPEFKFKTMVVRVLWPGASADEIARQVTDKLERKLQDTPRLDYLRSYSRPGESVIFVNLLGETRARDVDDTWYQVRKKASDVRGELPAGASGPYFNDEFGDTYSNIYALSGEGFGRSGRVAVGKEHSGAAEIEAERLDGEKQDRDERDDTQHHRSVVSVTEVWRSVTARQRCGHKRSRAVAASQHTL